MCDTVKGYFPSHTNPLAVVFTNTSSVYLLFNSECYSMSQNSSGSIVIRLWTGKPRYHGSIRGGERFLFGVQTTCGAHPAAYSMGTGVISYKVKQPGCGIDHSPALSAKVKNEWIYTSISSICLSCVHRNNLHASAMWLVCWELSWMCVANKL